MTTGEGTTGKAVFETPGDLLGAVGRELGATAWVSIGAAEVTRFAEATRTVVSGDEVPPLMVLSLTNRFLPELLEVRGVSSGVNYGSGRVSFPAGVQVDDRIRASAHLTEAVEVPGAVQTTVEISVEVQGSNEPACVVESLSRWMY